MVDKAALKQELGLDRFSPERQEEIFEQYTYEVGDAISDGMSDEQMSEFTEIINGNDGFIHEWLKTNVPQYHEDRTFKELQAAYDEDPEKVSAEKVYASIAWVRVNKPDLDDVVAGIKARFKAELADQPA